jgi:DNA-directed RNA polymerase specialized sigma24 family protein
MARPISDLIAALRAGEKVEDRIHEHYYRLAREYARSQIEGSLQSRINPSAIANAALKSALSVVANGRMRGYGSEDFKGLVLTIVSRKVSSAARREKAEADRYSGADVSHIPDKRELRPDEIAAMNEEIERLVTHILSTEDDTDRAIGYLHFIQGFSPAEITDWLQANRGTTSGKVIRPRAIQLRMKRMRDQLKELYPEWKAKD